MENQSIPQKEIEKQIQDQVDRIETAIIETLEYLGELCVSEARTGYTYIPRTGNLLSSVGYHVIKDGEFVKGSTFKADTGGVTGKTFIESLYSQFPKGIVLIVVAGMNYAMYVESRGLNVLTSSEMLANRMLPGIMNDLGFETTKK
jgi:hypothetical protein